MEIFSTFLHRRLRSLPTLTATRFRALLDVGSERAVFATNDASLAST